MYVPEEASARSSASSARESDGAARARVAPDGRRVEAAGRARFRRTRARRAPGSRAIVCWSRSGPTRRRSNSCARASAWRTRSMPSGRSSTSRRPRFCDCPNGSHVASTCCGSRSRWAPRRSRWTVRGGGHLLEYARRATRRASSSARRNDAAGALASGFDATELMRHHVDSTSPRSGSGATGRELRPAPPRSDIWPADPLGRYGWALTSTAACTAVASRCIRTSSWPISSWSIFWASQSRGFGSDAAPRARAVQCRDVRFLLRAAAVHVCSRGCAVSRDLLVMLLVALVIAADGERAAANARSWRARTAHRSALRHESRARGHPRFRDGSEWPSRTWQKCSKAGRSCCYPSLGQAAVSQKRCLLAASFRGSRLRLRNGCSDHGRCGGLGLRYLSGLEGLILRWAGSGSVAGCARGFATKPSPGVVAGAEASSGDICRADWFGVGARRTCEIAERRGSTAERKAFVTHS